MSEKASGPAHPAESIYGVWTREDGRQIAAYARYNAHHRGLVVYDAGTGRALSAKGHAGIAALRTVEPFVPNDAAPAKVDYVGERNNPSDPVRHDVPPGAREAVK